MTLIRIVASHFVAGLEATDRVVRAAPILKYMIGWNGVKVAGYCISKGWTWERLP
jgi:hypothetical protein